MSRDLRWIGTGELALRAANRPGAWLVLLTSSDAEAERAARELAEEIELTSYAPAVLMKACRDAVELATAFEQHPTGVIVAHGLEVLTPDDWAHVDLLRSRYLRADAVVLAMTGAAMDTLMQRAPNLASMISGAWQWDADAAQLSDEERARRLAALSEQTGYSNDDVIRLAEQGALPADPEYAEWLVLLARGELLDRD